MSSETDKTLAVDKWVNDAFNLTYLITRFSTRVRSRSARVARLKLL
jgi:hypothetical protein